MGQKDRPESPVSQYLQDFEPTVDFGSDHAALEGNVLFAQMGRWLEGLDFP